MSIREIHVATKKTSRQNSNSSVNNIFAQGVISQNSTGGIKLETDENPFSFQNEISDIMRGFGDCERPLRESVQLVEKILQQQLRGILNEAMDVATKRKSVPLPTQCDFEFVMRKHPVKINRMRKHIKDMRLLKRLLQMQAGKPQALIEDPNKKEDSDEECEIEIVEKFDEERTRRLFRADRISQILTGPQYNEFNEARRTSFYCRNSDKMRHKLKGFLNIPSDIRISTICLSILAYLAHETIATIVDYAILTRLNSENRLTEPFSRVTSSGAAYSMLHICPEVTQGRGSDGVKPITVQEIQEALRRFTMLNKRGMGFYRNSIDNNMRSCYLAI